MSDLSAFYGPNAGYVLEQYDRFLDDPAAVSDEFQQFFSSFDPSELEAVTGSAPAAVSATQPSRRPAATQGYNDDQLTKMRGASQLAAAIRGMGHLAVQLDPIGTPPPGAPELLQETWGLTDDDLKSVPAMFVGGTAAKNAANAFEAIAHLRDRYTTDMGFDFDHVQVAEEREWLQNAAETGEYDYHFNDENKKQLLERLTEVEGFEQFIHKTYPGVKRFSIEGLDIVVPMLDVAIADGVEAGAREIVMGMAHRGRLNVLAHTMGRGYGQIISQFENRHDEAEPPADFNGETDEVRAGDVKYHLGARLVKDPKTGKDLDVPVVLAPNPSHLEAVNPVVMGMTRAAQDDRTHPGFAVQDPNGAVGILLHGDAAFAGQGINAETMNMNAITGFSTGGTVHVIENNNIGYTTNPEDSRSTTYASDSAKGYGIPVIHVNADNPKACLSAMHIGMAYRKQFHKDFVLDVVGYRRYGHNEGDEPLFTQPLVYQAIQKHPTVRAIFAAELEKDGVVEEGFGDNAVKEHFAALTKIRRGILEDDDKYPAEWIEPMQPSHGVETKIDPERMRIIHEALHDIPEEFTPNRKLGRQLDQRSRVLEDENGKLDWGYGETMAFATILQDGTPIRFSGEDSQRGTWSQRHLVMHDANDGEVYIPIHHIPDVDVSFSIYNGSLSEYGGMGFEYGYTQNAPECLVLWEAQFGDFANGAQIVVDQFLSAARSKWGEKPSLVLLLPHGYEGQGPEHSSGRMERYLQMAAEDNMRIANCTTAAQYFHLLRLQAKNLKNDPRPLVVFTPKSLLRHPLAASAPIEFTEGEFHPVIDDPSAQDRKDQVTRLVLCSGKVAVDLEQHAGRENPAVAVARVELLAPFQFGPLKDLVESYPNLEELVWLQEEPQNMGAWMFMSHRLRDLVEDRIPVRYIGRPEQASPAEGYAEVHKANQEAIAAAAFAHNLPEDTAHVEDSSQQDGGEDQPSEKKNLVEVSTGSAD